MPSDTLQSRLHHDLEMPTIQETTKQFYQQYRDRLEISQAISQPIL